MRFTATTKLEAKKVEELRLLWNREYPESLYHKTQESFKDYLSGLQNTTHILLTDDKHEIRGWYFDFTRDGEKWFAIIIDTSLHGKGFGSRLLKMGMEKEAELNGWVIDHDNYKKVDGTSYESPLPFYLKHGFRKDPDIRLETLQISAVKIHWKEHT